MLILSSPTIWWNSTYIQSLQYIIYLVKDLVFSLHTQSVNFFAVHDLQWYVQTSVSNNFCFLIILGFKQGVFTASICYFVFQLIVWIPWLIDSKKEKRCSLLWTQLCVVIFLCLLLFLLRNPSNIDWVLLYHWQ